MVNMVPFAWENEFGVVVRPVAQVLGGHIWHSIEGVQGVWFLLECSHEIILLVGKVW